MRPTAGQHLKRMPTARQPDVTGELAVVQVATVQAVEFGVVNVDPRISR
jgi:hypothetical protein